MSDKYLQFPMDQIVEVDRSNTAHAVTEDGQGWACGQRREEWEPLPEDIRPILMHTWELNQTKEYRAWPSWPCQTCAFRLRQRIDS